MDDAREVTPFPKRKEKEREKADIAEPALSRDRYRGQIYGTERSQVSMVSTNSYILHTF